MATKKKTTTKKPATRKPTAKKKTKADRVDAAVKTVAKSVAAAKAKKPRAKKTGALDAAVKVLGEAKQPLTTREMIDKMAAKGYWKSTHGKTPDRTLYSAILREVVTKKNQARFKKTERGKFTLAK